MLHGYILADLTIKGTPDQWATAAVTGYYRAGADRIIGEVNNGGDMVEHTIRTIDPKVAFKKVHAGSGAAYPALWYMPYMWNQNVPNWEGMILVVLSE